MMQVERWDLFELSLSAKVDGNPFIDVTLEAEFTHGYRHLHIAGFYDGAETYVVRCMPDAEGAWRYVTHSNLPALDGHEGEFTCTPATPGNHGPVRVIDACHFAYADHIPYHPIGTTCYAWVHQGDALEEQTLATLQQSPFNKMRMCIFPKRYKYNMNEPPLYPFEVERPGAAWDPAVQETGQAVTNTTKWDYAHFNPTYFQHIERRVRDLRGLGIEADLILFHPYDSGAWGFDQLPSEVNDRYLAYLVARLAAFRNVWWSFANEYDLMHNRNLADWDHYFQLVQTLDPYDHLRSVHNCRGFYDHGKPWVTHCSVQHSGMEQVPEWLQLYQKPVVIDECGYEGDIPLAWGSLAAETLVEFLWQGSTVGGYVGHGETYTNPEECLWWSKGGQLSGESAARFAFLRAIIEAAPAPGLFPAAGSPHAAVFCYGFYKGMAAGHNGSDYYLLYLAGHQPRTREFNLPTGSYRIDIIDTWNMTVERFAEDASGHVVVELPRRQYLAVRIERNR
ncbi:MAG: DUF5605 domain-containing protein [Anaerolineae bacterium]